MRDFSSIIFYFPYILHNTYNFSIICSLFIKTRNPFTVKTRVSFRHSLRHRNSASASVVSTLKSVFLREKTTLLSVKTTLRLSYQVLKTGVEKRYFFFVPFRSVSEKYLFRFGFRFRFQKISPLKRHF
jgi:hypothetical protein